MANWYPHVDVGTPTHSLTHSHIDTHRKKTGLGQAGDGQQDGVLKEYFLLKNGYSV